MNLQECKSCGGAGLERVGNYYVCKFCGNKWLVDVSDDVNAVMRANAWEALRVGDFEKATALFEEILLKDKTNHEAYWGRALSMSGIVYVTDYNENKRVPTCNNITEDSFVDNKDVKNAIKYAPEEIKESYEKQAKQIEKIRVEWLEKASKEPAYDIFISYKDSDREHGLERTKDSIDVQDLYTALVSKGYNVFFSRVTLRDKVSEQYEPYIYNALKTAKVMIVFGEKAEYFSATWVKNEWTRFIRRIEKGEKHKNSLITVYKDVNPYEIPTALTGGRQALDYGVPSNFEILMNHVKRVIDASKQAVKLEKIEIKGGQIAKKSSTIQTETIKTREIGSGAKAETSIDDKQKLSLVYTFINSDSLEDASNLIDDILFENPNNQYALTLSLFVKYKITTSSKIDFSKLIENVSIINEKDFEKIEYIISISDKDFAKRFLEAIYDVNREILSLPKYQKLLERVLSFNFEGRNERIKNLFDLAIKASFMQAFNLLLTTLDSTAVDEYIEYNRRFLIKSPHVSDQKVCIKNILSVQEGNVSALRAKLLIEIYEDNKNTITTLETLLKYTKDIKKEVIDTIYVIVEQKNFTSFDSELAGKVLKYYPGEISELESELVAIANVMVSNGHFDDAEKICSLILGFNKNNPFVYWCLCLCKLKAKNKNEVITKDESIKKLPEYTKYLTYVSEEERKEAIELSKDQEVAIKKREEQRLEAERIKAEKERIAKRKAEEAETQRLIALANEKKRSRNLIITAIISLILITGIVLACVLPGIAHDKKLNNKLNEWSKTGYSDGYVRDGEYIYFGVYPQTIKEDGVTVGETASENGYYLGSDGAYYAKVEASPYDTDYTFSNETTIIADQTYYFRVEPIKWRILSEKDGKVLLLSEEIITNRRFDNGADEWYSCELRDWLNGNFYEKAFTDSQANMIETVTFSNGFYTNSTNSNKVFLFDSSELEESSYGFKDLSRNDKKRRKTATDYSKATGVLVNDKGNGAWWTRWVWDEYDGEVVFVTTNGFVYEHKYTSRVGKAYASESCYGVAPAIKINLNK